MVPLRNSEVKHACDYGAVESEFGKGVSVVVRNAEGVKSTFILHVDAKTPSISVYECDKPSFRGHFSFTVMKTVEDKELRDLVDKFFGAVKNDEKQGRFRVHRKTGETEFFTVPVHFLTRDEQKTLVNAVRVL